MVSLKPVIFGVRGNECVARLVRGRSVKPFNHQESSNLSTLTLYLELEEMSVGVAVAEYRWYGRLDNKNNRG